MATPDSSYVSIIPCSTSPIDSEMKESAAYSSNCFSVDSEAEESHAPFFCKEVLQRFEAQSLSRTNNNVDVHKVQQVTNIHCHICHMMKPVTVMFICEIHSHCYREMHLNTRLEILTKELIGNTSEKSKKYHEGYCPICTLHCTCATCLRRLDAIQDYVASLCWAERSSSATSSIITESEVEKIVTKVVASLDLLSLANESKRIPIFNKTTVFTAASILAAAREPARKRVKFLIGG